MLLGTHLITGAVAGEYLDNPFLAFAAGFILHFIIDAIPHFDTTDNDKMTFRQMALIFVDGIIGIIIVFYCYKDFSVHKMSYLAGALGGILPDILDNVPFWEKSFQKSTFGRNFHNLHKWVQSIKLSPIPGLAIQYLIIAVAVLILVKLK
jgi:hypothetical protein